MPVFKCTALFQWTSAVSTPAAPLHRVAGWSESVYLQAPDQPTAIQEFVTGGLAIGLSWCQERAALLPLGGSIVGQRIQQVSPVPAAAQSLNNAFPSLLGLEGDSPQTTLLIRFPSQVTNNIRRYFLRAVPDPCVTEGEFTPTPAFGLALAAWINGMNGFAFQARDLSQAKQPVLSGTAAGVFTLVNPPVGIAVGTMVRLLKVRDANGYLRGGRFQVTAVTSSPNVVTVAGWPFPASTGGNMRVDATIYPFVLVSQTTVGRIVSKKVGRPSTGYRGRRSRRR